jgi:pyruvate dehydrogenase E2 component (dihydrolipoamide acetyltransferase)
VEGLDDISRRGTAQLLELTELLANLRRDFDQIAGQSNHRVSAATEDLRRLGEGVAAASFEASARVHQAGDAIRMAIAAAMSKSKREIPHYYIEKRIDMSKALAFLQDMNRQRSPQKRIMMPALLIKAVARALDDVPQLNAVWEGGLQLKEEINIGFVVALRSGGIIVPAVLRADVKSVEEIMDALNDLIPRAKALKLHSSELSDSTITLTSLGDGTADKVFGIIYPPQVAIVGFGGISDQAVARDGMLGIAPVMVATLAGDHRASDGLTGSRFLSSLNQHLQNPAAL